MDKIENTNEQWHNQVRALVQGDALVRLLRTVLALTLFCLVLGTGFFLIFLGLIWIVLRLAPYWWPAYWFLARLSGIRDIPATIRPPVLPWWHLVLLLVRLVLGLLLIFFGVQLLVRQGFYGQNIIWSLVESG
jgi:hypothetical protein